MSRTSFTRSFGLALIAVIALSVASSASHSWGTYHWARTANPFNLKLGDNVNATWDPILVTTSTDWSLSTVLNTSIVAGGTQPRNCRPTKGRVEVCNASYGNTGWLGVAQIWINGSHITQGTVKNNDTYFNTPAYNTTAWRNLVMCQEVGHTFGLDHQDENFNNPNLGTCMDYTNNPVTNQHPNAHDFQQLETIYAHLDSTTTVGAATAPGNGQIDLPHQSQWGKLIRVTHNGRTALFELDLGGGQKVFTFVIWA